MSQLYIALTASKNINYQHAYAIIYIVKLGIVRFQEGNPAQNLRTILLTA